jgi:hypothetical protein
MWSAPSRSSRPKHAYVALAARPHRARACANAIPGTGVPPPAWSSDVLPHESRPSADADAVPTSQTRSGRRLSRDATPRHFRARMADIGIGVPGRPVGRFGGPVCKRARRSLVSRGRWQVTLQYCHAVLAVAPRFVQCSEVAMARTARHGVGGDAKHETFGRLLSSHKQHAPRPSRGLCYDKRHCPGGDSCSDYS